MDFGLNFAEILARIVEYLKVKIRNRSIGSCQLPQITFFMSITGQILLFDNKKQHLCPKIYIAPQIYL